jgi:PKD repeat protein
VFVEKEHAVSEVLDETLIIALGLVCAAVVGILFFGFAVPVEKSAYLVPQFGTQTIGGQSVITVYDRGGDPVYFNATPLAKYKADFFVDTATGTFRAVPASTLTVFKPGDTVYIYNTGTGFAITGTPAGISAVSLPAGGIVVRIVDSAAGTLIAKETIVPGPVVPVTTTTTATITPTTTTATPTATPTPSLTATTTTPVGPLLASFDWINIGSRNVQFTSTSTGSPTSWVWDFNDGDTTQPRNDRKVTHKFPGKGTYTVILTVTRSTDGATSSATATVTVD